jgi:hypothetical protein
MLLRDYHASHHEDVLLLLVPQAQQLECRGLLSIRSEPFDPPITIILPRHERCRATRRDFGGRRYQYGLACDMSMVSREVSCSTQDLFM